MPATPSSDDSRPPPLPTTLRCWIMFGPGAAIAAPAVRTWMETPACAIELNSPPNSAW